MSPESLSSDEAFSIVSDLGSEGEAIDLAFQNVGDPVMEPANAEITSSQPELILDRHPVFFFEDDLVEVHVGSIAFRVHAYLFERESDEARSFIDSRRNSQDGIITSDDISATDFEKFLAVLYSKSYNPVQLQTKSDWISVLSLSHIWNFATIRAWAIRELVHITTSVDKLVLARDYAVQEWRADAYLDVCTTPHWLSDEDGHRLGLEAVMKIGRARDAFRTLGTLISSEQHAFIVANIFGLCNNTGEKDVPTPAAGQGRDPNTAPSRSNHQADMLSEEPIGLSPIFEPLAQPLSSSLSPTPFSSPPSVASPPTAGDIDPSIIENINKESIGVGADEVCGKMRQDAHRDLTAHLGQLTQTRILKRYAPYGTPEELVALHAAIDETESWIRSAEYPMADAVQIMAQLQHLQSLARPVGRYQEAQALEAAIARYKTATKMFGQKRPAKVKKAEWTSAVWKRNQVNAWLKSAFAEQQHLAKHVEPVLTAEMVRSRGNEIVALASSIAA